MKTRAVRLYGKNDFRLEEFELPEITEDEIVEKLTETYDVTEEIARENVKKVVDGFRKIGFLQE